MPEIKWFCVSPDVELSIKEVASEYVVSLLPSASDVDSMVETLQRTIGEEDQVILGLSGGVDSSVAALLLHKAIGKRLHGIFVNNGLLRKDEYEDVPE